MTHTRLHGFDILRLLTMVAVVNFHTHETLLYTDSMPAGLVGTFHDRLQPYSRFIAFGGFTLVLLTTFLAGLGRFDTRRAAKLLALIWVGFFALAAVEADAGQWFLFEWDIYAFLACAFSLLYALQSRPRLLHAATILTLPMLVLPVWDWISLTSWPSFWREALIGDCTRRGGGGWPLLPWIALPLLGFSLGRMYKSHRTTWQRFWLLEWAIWGVALLASTSFLGGYFEVPIGPGFSCFVHRRPPYVLWSHLIWVLFFARVSLLPSVNQWLAQTRVARAISSLHWSRHFGLCYVLHLVWLGVGCALVEDYSKAPRAIDVFLLSVFPVTELLSRAGFAIRDAATTTSTRPS